MSIDSLHTDLPDWLSLRFDGQGGVEDPPDPADVPDAGFDWMHLRRDAGETATRLAALGLDEVVVHALTAQDTRPRCTVHGDGVLLLLRGVNLNPGADPEDMVSVRLWLEERRVVGVWLRPLYAVGDVLAAARRGQGPQSPGDFAARLALRLADRADPAVAAINEAVDDLETDLEAMSGTQMRRRLLDLRRQAIILRRYMLPQRDALSTFEIEDLAWLRARDRTRLREAAERVARLGEDLDALRDRAQVVQDHLMDQRAEAMNRQMLLLSVVAAVFLPLGLLSGMLGMNVGGLPGADLASAFWIVTAGMVAIGGGLWLLFRWLGFRA
ncbi:zinc transporter ZntB [Lacimonas salitolerans]|uniref:Zinc transporter ZntB n=1 Tax=Lacimonas salitolerans TaxID=1323750 RepID=A0ABW4EM50_9RHOB